MSEHTKGRLEAFTQESFSGWYALRDQDHFEVGSGDGGFDEADARRLAACWNAFDAPCMTTPMIEALVKIGGVDALSDQAAAAMKARDAAQSELAAARALLREVYEEGNLDIGDQVSKELDNRIISYLDACDTLGGNSEVGS